VGKYLGSGVKDLRPAFGAYPLVGFFRPWHRVPRFLAVFAIECLLNQYQYGTCLLVCQQ
jgi:hypothetical protein